MKTLFLGPKVSMSLPFVLNHLKKLAGILIATLFSLSAFSQELVFRNPVLDAGSDGANFNAVLQNKQVMLNWATTEEKNLSHFVIEKCINSVSSSAVKNQLKLLTFPNPVINELRITIP